MLRSAIVWLSHQWSSQGLEVPACLAASVATSAAMSGSHPKAAMNRKCPGDVLVPVFVHLCFYICCDEIATQVAHLNAEVRSKQCVDYFKLQQQLQQPGLSPDELSSLQEQITVLLCYILGRSDCWSFLQHACPSTV